MSADVDNLLNTVSSCGRVVTLVRRAIKAAVEIVSDVTGINNGICEIVNFLRSSEFGLGVQIAGLKGQFKGYLNLWRSYCGRCRRCFCSRLAP